MYCLTGNSIIAIIRLTAVFTIDETLIPFAKQDDRISPVRNFNGLADRIISVFNDDIVGILDP